VVSDCTTWLYIRSRETVSVVVRGAEVAVYGPGADFSLSRFPDSIDAMLHHAHVEEALIRAGWTLEQMTTERRAGPVTMTAGKGARTDQPLRLVERGH
jgi:hypothetical protein